jgi:hypothetical protein
MAAGIDATAQKLQPQAQYRNAREALGIMKET